MAIELYREPFIVQEGKGPTGYTPPWRPNEMFTTIQSLDMRPGSIFRVNVFGDAFAASERDVQLSAFLGRDLDSGGQVFAVATMHIIPNSQEVFGFAAQITAGVRINQEYNGDATDVVPVQYMTGYGTVTMGSQTWAFRGLNVYSWTPASLGIGLFALDGDPNWQIRMVTMEYLRKP